MAKGRYFNSGRGGGEYRATAATETGRQRAPELLTPQIVVGRCHSAANLAQVEARLTFRPSAAVSAIGGELLLSLAELRRYGKILRNGGHCGGSGRRRSRGRLRKHHRRRCAQQQDQGMAKNDARSETGKRDLRRHRFRRWSSAAPHLLTRCHR